jgi:type IV pilus assembly protein PilB
MQKNHQQSSVLNALAKQNIIASDLIDSIAEDSVDTSKPFIRFLIEDKNLDSKNIAKVLSKSFGYPQIELNQFDTKI